MIKVNSSVSLLIHSPQVIGPPKKELTSYQKYPPPPPQKKKNNKKIKIFVYSLKCSAIFGQIFFFRWMDTGK